MKTLFRILGTVAAVAVTGAAIVALDKIARSELIVFNRAEAVNND